MSSQISLRLSRKAICAASRSALGPSNVASTSARSFIGTPLLRHIVPEGPHPAIRKNLRGVPSGSTLCPTVEILFLWVGLLFAWVGVHVIRASRMDPVATMRVDGEIVGYVQHDGDG